MTPKLFRVAVRLEKPDFEKLRKYSFKHDLSYQVILEKAVRDLLSSKDKDWQVL